MNDGLALALKTLGVALGIVAVVLGALETITSLMEGRRPWLGLGILAAGLAVVVPIVALGVRDMIREERKTGGA